MLRQAGDNNAVHAEDGIARLQMENQIAVPGDGGRYRVEELRGLLGCQELRDRRRAGMIASGARILRRNIRTRGSGCRLSPMRPKARQTKRGQFGCSKWRE